MGLLGIHGSISGGLSNAIDEADGLGCGALQIFTANQRMWAVKNFTAADAAAFAAAWKKSGIRKIVSHNSYLVNLASFDPELLEKSRAAFMAEMRRVAELKLDALILHPGSFTGGGLEGGIDNIADSINTAFAGAGDFPSMLLETTAGSGSSIGGKFGELAMLIKKIKLREKVGVCFDTAHVFESGYDTKNDYKGVFAEFDRVVGLEKIGCFHINDSKTEFASKADRHWHIGLGHIGEEFFGKLVNDRRFKNIPMILETPKEGDMDAKNLAVLRKMEK